MKGAAALLCLDLAVLVNAATEGGRPRGVGPEFAKYYKDAKTFSCILDPSISIPFSRVNDDYCDCPDGSDEPGTAACSHLSPLSPPTPDTTGGKEINVSLPGFYCKNKGHIPSYVPFTYVNDGVCDYELCCDGSDEWVQVGGTKCEDKCAKIGKEWKKQDDARQKSLAAATRKRKELVMEATKLKLKVQEKINLLTVQVGAGQVKVKQLEQTLAEVEKKERGKVFKGSVGAKAGKLGILVGLARQRTEELRGSLTRVREERDAGWARLKELEALLATFKEEYNPNFNDEGVKRAVRAWEDYVARDKGSDPDAAQDHDLDAISKEDKENGLDWSEYETEEESEIDVLYQLERYLPPVVRGWVDQKLRDFRIMLIDNGILADNSGSVTESRAVVAAREQLETAKSDLERNQNDLNNDQAELDRDFGPDDVFRALKGQCVTQDSGEYTYELCFMGQTSQISKKGGSQTNMGEYTRMETIDVDDELPANGKGLGSGKRIAMKHENGQHCWNGPNRSTTVVLACSETNEIWKIVEEEKCVYRMEVGTPAVCGMPVGKDGGVPHAEL